MNTQTRASRGSLAIVLGSVLAALVMLGGPAGAGGDPTSQRSGAAEAFDDSTASGGCVAAHSSVCSGSGVAINGSTSSGDAVAIDGSVTSGCSIAVDGSTASGGDCDKHHDKKHHDKKHHAPEAEPATPTAVEHLTFTG